MLSPGTTFGGHYLLYESSRETEHVRLFLVLNVLKLKQSCLEHVRVICALLFFRVQAYAIVVAKPWPLRLKLAETVAMGRLGHATKKLVIFAAYDQAKQLVQEVSATVLPASSGGSNTDFDCGA